MVLMSVDYLLGFLGIAVDGNSLYAAKNDLTLSAGVVGFTIVVWSY